MGTLLTLSMLWYRFRSKRISHHQNTSSSYSPFFGRRQPRPHFVIGILTPLPNSSALHIKQGIVQQLSSSPQATYSIKLFHGNNDRVTLFSEALSALKQCDILVSFGLACTNIAYEAARHHNMETPIIFAGIKSHHIPLLRRKNLSEKLSGIISQRDYVTQINQLRTIKPAMKNVLIIYRQQLEWVTAQVGEMAAYLQSLDINAVAHLLPHGNHIDNQLGTIKHSFDTIILMPHTLDAKGIQELITYCNLKAVTFCANEIDAVTLGAAIGFGGEEIIIGTRVGRTIRDTLEVGKQLKEDTIIEHIDHYQVHLNARALTQQGVCLTPELLFLLKQGEVTHTNDTMPLITPTSLPVGSTLHRDPTSVLKTSHLISSWEQLS